MTVYRVACGLIAKLILLALGAGAYAVWGWIGWLSFSLMFVVSSLLAEAYFAKRAAA